MDKNKRILTYVIALIVLAIGVTFAYFVAQTGDGAKSNVNIKADSVDDLKFSVNKDLSLSANQFNFAQGSGNLSDSVTATASLKANSTKKLLHIIIMYIFKWSLMNINIQQRISYLR